MIDRVVTLVTYCLGGNCLIAVTCATAAELLQVVALDPLCSSKKIRLGVDVPCCAML